jgi:multiple sugar transport system substrate-binding protein
MGTTRRVIIALGLVLLFAGVVSAGTTLEFTSHQITEPGFADWWKEGIARFESQHPDVKIQATQEQFEVHHNKMQTRFAAGNPPDIVHVSTRFYFDLAARGLLEPLDSYLAKDDILKDWIPLQKTMVVGGKTYGVLLLNHLYAMYYNEQMFKEAGVSPPKTMDDLGQAAKRLTTGPGRYGISLVTAPSTDMYLEFSKLLGGLGGDWTPGGKLTVNSPEAVQALTFYRGLVQSGYAPRNQLAANARLLFFTGKTAMIIDGPFILAMKAKAPDTVKPYVRVMLPPFKRILTGQATSISMAASLDPAKKKLVWDFMKVLASPEMQRKQAELIKAPGMLKGSVTPDIVAKIPEMDTFTKSMSMADVAEFPVGYERNFEVYSKILIDSFSEALSTNRDSKAILDDAQKKIEAALK